MNLFCSRFAGVLTLACGLFASRASAQLYSQNFDGTAIGALPTGWVSASGGWTVQQQTGSTSHTLDSSATGAGPEVAYYNNATFDTGYAYSASLRLWGSGTGNEASVVYYYKDATHFYEFGLAGNVDVNGKGIWRVYEHNGAISNTAAATGTFTSPGGGNWVTVQVARSGTSTTFSINGIAVLTRTQSLLTGGGRIGFSDRYAGARGDNVTVTDTVAPTVAMTAPANNANVSGNVTLSATASDNVGVASVRFTLDGADLNPLDSSPPYSITWDSTPVAPGSHVLRARASDAAGLTTTSGPINVTVANGLPPTWTNSDIGGPAAAGTTNYSNGTFFIDGGGTNIWGTSDKFQFARQPASADFTIVARVTGVEAVATWSKAGIMVREDTTAGSRYVFLGMTPAHGLLFEARTDNVSPNNSSIQPAVQGSVILPLWLKLVRSGDNFSAAYSTDGTIWSSAGMIVLNSNPAQRQSTVNVKMAAAVSAGLAVCSTVDGSLCSATFDNVAVTLTPTAGYNPAFPRLGNYAIGGHYTDGQAYFAETRSMLSKFHVAIISGSGETWASGRSEGGVDYTREDVVAGIKNQSAIGTKVLQYVILESSRQEGPQLPTWHQRVTNNNWWLWLSGTSGSQVENAWGASLDQPDHFWQVNPTVYVPADSATGMRPFEWGAMLVHDIFVNPAGTYGITGMAAPSLDGIFLDDVFPWTKADGDWNRNSQANDPTDRGFHEFNDYSTTAAGWWQAAQVTYFNKIRLLMPGKLQVGNTAEFGNIARPQYTDLTRIGPLNQLMQGGLLEPALGAGGLDGWGGPNYTENLRQYYFYTMSALAAPKLLVFEHRMSLSGTDSFDATSYRAMRYGLACCLMNDGYFDANSDNSTLHTNADTRWFDEFSVYNGAGQLLTSANVHKGLGYLGRPLANANGAPQTHARFAAGGTHGTFGVWAREFEGGIVLMSSRGNGAATITVGASGTDLSSADWKRINGTQATTVNSGADVTGNISLADRDAIILLRR